MEYSQCTNEQCNWFGTDEEYSKVPSANPDFEDIVAHDNVCPKCGNDEFYVLNEEKYNELKTKETYVMPDECPQCGSDEIYEPNPRCDPNGPYCLDCGASIEKVPPKKNDEEQ